MEEGQIRGVTQSTVDDHYRTIVDIPLTALVRMTVWRVAEDGTFPFFFLKKMKH